MKPRGPAVAIEFAGRLDALDGLRTVAVLAVFLFHGAQGVLRGGFLGVDVFFVLSGTVITLLLLREYERTRRIRFGRFYLNRLARLWPALLVVCLVVAVVSRIRPGPTGNEIGPAIAAASYFIDVVRGFHLWGFSDGSALGHTWSLAVEEQFYLVWPLLFVVLMRALGLRRTAAVTGVLLLVPIALRAALWDGGAGLDRIYNMPDTRADELLAGCLLALTLTFLRGSGTAVRRVLVLAIWPATATLLALMLVFQGPRTVSPGPAFAVEWIAGQLAVAVVVALLVGGLAVGARHPLSRLLASRWMSWPGRHLSYGFYLWHIPVLVLLGYTGLRVSLRLVVAFALTAPIAYLSSRFLEEPIRRAVRDRENRRVASLDDRRLDAPA